MTSLSIAFIVGLGLVGSACNQQGTHSGTDAGATRGAEAGSADAGGDASGSETKDDHDDEENETRDDEEDESPGDDRPDTGKSDETTDDRDTGTVDDPGTDTGIVRDTGTRPDTGADGGFPSDIGEDSTEGTDTSSGPDATPVDANCKPSSEICDGVDNDCDGETDETCPHRVFVTSRQYDGKRGGPSRIDTLCNNVADEAGLQGNWKAIVSSGLDDASDRITIDGEVYNLDDTVVADNASDMWDGTLDASIAYTENGVYLGSSSSSDPDVWTGTNQLGEVNVEDGDCNGWNSNDSGATGGRGLATEDYSAWLNHLDLECWEAARFYCIDGQPAPSP